MSPTTRPSRRLGGIAALLLVGTGVAALASDAAPIATVAVGAPVNAAPTVSQEPDPCDVDGVSVAYSVGYRPSTPAGYHIDAVAVNDLAPNCSASTVLVRLLDGVVTVATGGPTPYAGVTTSVAIPAPAPASEIDGLYVEISGVPVPDECVDMAFDTTSQFADTNDAATGGSQRDLLVGRGGNDHLAGRGAADCVAGGGENDRLDGDAGDDTLVGGDGNDNLGGGPGDDRLHGGPGIDNLDGGPGYDVCDGGPGNTTYRNCEVRQ